MPHMKFRYCKSADCTIFKRRRGWRENEQRFTGTMTGEMYDDLMADIAENGIRDPIIIEYVDTYEDVKAVKEFMVRTGNNRVEIILALDLPKEQKCFFVAPDHIDFPFPGEDIALPDLAAKLRELWKHGRQWTDCGIIEGYVR